MHKNYHDGNKIIIIFIITIIVHMGNDQEQQHSSVFVGIDPAKNVPFIGHVIYYYSMTRKLGICSTEQFPQSLLRSCFFSSLAKRFGDRPQRSDIILCQDNKTASYLVIFGSFINLGPHISPTYPTQILNPPTFIVFIKRCELYVICTYDDPTSHHSRAPKRLASAPVLTMKLN